MENVNLIEAVKVARNDRRWVSNSWNWVTVCLVPAIAMQCPNASSTDILVWIGLNSDEVVSAVESL